MVPLQHVLCPIDFSNASRRALEHATMIAHLYGAGLTAMHVAHPPVDLPPAVPGKVTSHNGHLTASDLDDIAAHVRAWLAPASGSGLKTQVIVEEGMQPISGIAACSSSLPADLLVLGTHGRTGFDRLLLGSVTEKVLRKVSCPVLTVPPAAAHPSQLPYKRILCPVDFSPSSLGALDFAMSMARQVDAWLTVLSVFEWSAAPISPSAISDAAAYLQEYETEFRNRLETLVSDEDRESCRLTTLVLTGKPYEEILAFARQNDTDLIVMGVHGRHVFDQTIFGSTTNQVVRHAICPVLTLRRRHDAQE